jgi:spore coat protein CotH
MRQTGAAAIALMVGCLILGDGGLARAQTATDLFDDALLHDVHLWINSRDLLELRAQHDQNTYYPADLLWRDQRVRNVAVRSRGSGTRNPIKLGLRVDFNYYTTAQEFLGLHALVLDNLWQDDAMMREVLAMAVYRRMGQPAPRVSFCRLYINNVYQGMYAIVEEIDLLFVERTLGEREGYLFEYRWVTPYFMTDLGDDLDAYKPLFDPRSHERESDAALYGPIRDLFHDVDGPNDGGWLERAGARIDLEQFMTHVAIQGCLSQNDGILGYAGINNFYLYRPSGSGRYRIFPWDEDNAFTFLDASLLQGSDQGVVLFQRAFALEALRTLFLDVAERCARMVAEDGWLSAQVDRLAALVTPAAFEDTRKAFSDDQFLQGVAYLREFAATRPSIVLKEIAMLRQPSGP